MIPVEFRNSAITALCWLAKRQNLELCLFQVGPALCKRGLSDFRSWLYFSGKDICFQKEKFSFKVFFKF